jgi:hypothetical protein
MSKHRETPGGRNLEAGAEMSVAQQCWWWSGQRLNDYRQLRRDLSEVEVVGNAYAAAH